MIVTPLRTYSSRTAVRDGVLLSRAEVDAARRIRLRFHERECERTQEFSLTWCPAAGGGREIIRQQWNFSPGDSRTAVEQ